MDNQKKRFNSRAFATLTIALSGVGLPITGIVNHVYDFSHMTVARHAWMTAHNVLGLIFLVFSIWHATINHRALWNYLKGAAARVPRFSSEAAVACAVTTLILLLTVGHAFHSGR